MSNLMPSDKNAWKELRGFLKALAPLASVEVVSLSVFRRFYRFRCYGIFTCLPCLFLGMEVTVRSQGLLPSGNQYK
ncbi:uncharacterized [Tachysurus ichikawai]